MAPSTLQDILASNSVTLVDLANHVFLFKKLPQSEEPNIINIEQALLELVSYSVDTFKSNLLFSSVISLLHSWTKVQEHPLDLQEELRKLQNGGSVCIYVRKQNCTLLFTKLNGEKARVATFRASLLCKHIAETSGILKVEYPETVDIIPFSDFLLSSCFSQQVEHLTQTSYSHVMPTTRKAGKDNVETREPAYPYMITEFLLGMLCPIKAEEFGTAAETLQEIKLTKKVRDQVNWDNSQLPFRRSGLWTSIKVILHTILYESLGENGDVLYKVAMLNLLSIFAKEYINSKHVSWDVAAEMMIKLARRNKKLCMYSRSSNKQVEEQKKDTISRIFTLIKSIHDITSSQWNAITFPRYSTITPILQTDRDWLADTLHFLPQLSNYVQSSENSLAASCDTVDENLDMIDPVDHSITLKALLNLSVSTPEDSSQDPHLNSNSVWIYDVEQFAKSHLQSELPCKDIYNLLIAYLNKVANLYGNVYQDPLYYSRMIVTTLSFVYMLDKAAVSKHDLLKQYATGITPNLFESLLLPCHEDMRRIEYLQSYFERRNAMATEESWVESSKVQHTSFAVRYARNDINMMNLKERILQDAEYAIKRKKEEVESKKPACLALHKQWKEITFHDDYTNLSGWTVHDWHCRKCAVEERLEQLRHSVPPYQRPLPPQDFLRDAVVFELQIPEEIAYVRDSVVLLLGELLGATAFTKNKGQNFWTHFRGLAYYSKTGFQGFSHLGSDTKDMLSSHYANHPPDLLTEPVDNFIVENGMNCVYIRDSIPGFVRPNNPCTFSIHSTEFSSVYLPLQCALDANRATENEIISLQYQCPQNLTLKEFITFGSIRCGHRIQSRNLYAALATQTLSLEKEPVLSLIMQAIWELGPKSDRREIYEDLTLEENEPFVTSFLQLLEKIRKENETNWSTPLILLSVVTIGTRFLELSPSVKVKETAQRFLQNCRLVIEDWCEKIDKLISQSVGSNPRQTKLLSEMLLKACICGLFTFNVSSPDLIPYVLSNEHDITFYLKSISRLYSLINRDNIAAEMSMSAFMENLLRHARVSIPLSLEDFLHKSMSSSSSAAIKAFSNYVSYQWPTVQMSKNVSVNFYNRGHYMPNKKHVYIANYVVADKNHVVFVDILRGAFFVDGYPPSDLPEKIIKHPLYRRFFQTNQLSVQRDSQLFTTTKEYYGFHYLFADINDKLIIRRLTASGQWYELLSTHLLSGCISHDLVDNYTHWLNSGNKAVHFLSHLNNDNHAELELNSDYVLVPTATYETGISPDWFLRKHVESEQTAQLFLLSIESSSYLQFSKVLRQLEIPEFMHVTVDKGNLDISVHLWRLNLSFTLNRDNGLLHCNNYPGYYIPTFESGGQSLGTLVGLQNGLILEKVSNSEPSGKAKLFVIQHGTIKISHQKLTPHQSVAVTRVGERSPKYFVYEVDQLLCSLRAENDKSAWLYLAALHAATSSPLIDSFTQLTGAESAVGILQSGFIWSCSPYDAECTYTLQQIFDMSPIYKYYPEHLKVMQRISWPKGLSENSYAAFDGYALIVQRLIKDSRRLSGLFVDKLPDVEFSDLELCIRSYYRHINLYNQAAHLSNLFVEEPSYPACISVEELDTKKSLSDLQNLSTLSFYRIYGKTAPTEQLVTPFILTCSPLPYQTKDHLTNSPLATWAQAKLHNNWLQIYSIALNSKSNDKEHELTMILGSLLYFGGESLTQLLNLHNIANSQDKNAIAFPEPVVSLTEKPFEPLQSDFIPSTIESIVANAEVNRPKIETYGTKSQYEEALLRYDNICSKEKQSTAALLKLRNWPASSIDLRLLERLSGENTIIKDFNSSVVSRLNETLQDWYNNLNLTLFITDVDEILKGLPNQEPHTSCVNASSRLVLNPTAFPQDTWILSGCTGSYKLPSFSSKSISSQFMQLFKRTMTATEQLQISMDVFFTGELGSLLEFSSTTENKRSDCLKYKELLLQSLPQIYHQNCPGNIGLYHAGVYIRTAPAYLIRSHLAKDFPESRTDAKIYVGALAVTLLHIRRFNRLILFSESKDKYAVELSREQETIPCRNWNPKRNMEWLLLELELGVTIRPIQVEVAERMMNMPKEKNGVMQLNMGEGKTSVIIPMIVATLSSRKDLLCRVTVLSSIYTTNFNLLTFAIGGFLNKRLYTVPCRRDLDVIKYTDEIRTTYEECIRLGGAVITLPEYRLSFRLLTYDTFLQNGMEDALKMYQIESWLRTVSRDLVDESDEIFSVKYQLVYTTGKQIKIDGGDLRWKTCRRILRLLPDIALKLLEKFGTTHVEFDPELYAQSPHHFSHFRVLNEECKVEFRELIADEILGGNVSLIGKMLRGEERKLVREYLTNEDISENDNNKFLNDIEISSEKKLALMLISGYLRKGILFSALKKRWRVEFGVKKPNEDATTRLMAVPFRAKDVAAERTEFGHPDMAIVLTHLSYYYSGLTDLQLLQCFDFLERGITEPEKVYSSWINGVPSDQIKLTTIKTYKGINLQDYDQRDIHLFPLLRRHRDVVDFWLENIAFPRECRQFPGKLVTNAWDLCYETNEHATTGFSGTNDTSLLLPAQLTQQDLEVLAETNTKMEETLKRKENQWKRTMRMGAGCKDVLQFVVEDDLRVLIDSGALMLELGNEKIAELWMELDSKLEAVVYFNEKGEMVVKEKLKDHKKQKFKTKDTLLALSPLKEQLEKCAVYLDDQHTRGTDIKLPTHFKACVTVGSGMRRDKLIQACMRMRKLGKGQSVHFYLSHEVHNKIRQEVNNANKITVDHILAWVKANSRQFEEDGLLYWASNARTYAKNLAADELFSDSEKSSEDCSLLAQRCQDPDAQNLIDMYGTYHHRVLATELIPRWFFDMTLKLATASDSSRFNMPLSLYKTLEQIKTTVLSKCKTFIPNKVYFYSMIDEEQEKELEPELEMEEERYLPTRETPVKPTLHSNVLRCVENENFVYEQEGIAPLAEVFRNTSVWAQIQDDEEGWQNMVFASQDFINVVETGNDLDSFLRPLKYFVSFNGPSNCTNILILSMYEVNELALLFRRKKCPPGTTLHMFSPRRMKCQPILANTSALQLPIRSDNQAAIIDEHLKSILLIAAGNLFFGDNQEQMAFARFLGLRLQPRNEQEEEAFQNKKITNTGFVLPLRGCGKLRLQCKFLKDPTDTVLRILKMRNEVVQDTDHTFQILDSCAYLSLNEVTSEDDDPSEIG